MKMADVMHIFKADIAMALSVCSGNQTVSLQSIVCEPHLRFTEPWSTPYLAKVYQGEPHARPLVISWLTGLKFMQQ